MKSRVRHGCLFAWMVLLLKAAGGSGAAEAEDASRAKAKLVEIRGRISTLTDRLGGELKERDVREARLREAELSITAKRRELDGLRLEQIAADRRRGELRTESAREQKALDAERADLASAARAAYMMGPEDPLKLLLNQTDPHSVGRMSVYYGYVARERARRIAIVDEEVEKLSGLATQVDAATAKLQELQTNAVRQMADLSRAREERIAALAAIRQQVRGGNVELAELKHRAEAEEALVAQLSQVLQDFPVDTQHSFAALRGKLNWPVHGRVTARYQDPAVGVRRDGVLIEADRGSKVRAPYFGRVIYADWLQGLGLLLILGHEGDYMTLYGHAEVLYKTVGDSVAPGDVIAGMGDAPGAEPHLYFEIREGRKPVDPKIWLKSAP